MKKKIRFLKMITQDYRSFHHINSQSEPGRTAQVIY